jgi:ParB/Sulfiredoxin domain
MVVQARPAPSTELAVHPIAAMFPMMPDEELDDLAADIKEHGLRFPIVLDQDEVLIDGRNRLEACRRAGVEPTFRTLEPGEDPVAFIVSANLQHRFMTKGQRAMAGAHIVAFNLKEKGKQVRVASNVDVSEGHVSKALTVLKYSADLASLVLSGDEPLHVAYARALEAKRILRTEEDVARQAAADLAAFRALAPELADQVAEGRLALAEARVVFADRERKARELRERQSRDFYNTTATLRALLRNREGGAAAFVADLDPTANPFRDVPSALDLWTRDGMAELAALLSDVGMALAKTKGGPA